MTTLDERVARIEGRLDQFATKEDLAKMETRLIKWMVGQFVGAIAVASTLAVVIERMIN